VKITGSSAPDWDRLIDSPSTSSLGTRSKQRSTGGAKRAVKTRAQMEIEMRIKMEMKLDSKVGLWVRRRSERLTMPDVYRAFGQVEKSARRQGAERKGSLWSLWPKTLGRQGTYKDPRKGLQNLIHHSPQRAVIYRVLLLQSQIALL